MTFIIVVEVSQYDTKTLPFRETTMTDDYQAIYEVLHRIYKIHRCYYPENGDSKQMCCMWSTHDPPDIIEDTPPFTDIEDACGVSIHEGIALELYDMYLDEAARKIIEIRKSQCRQ